MLSGNNRVGQFPLQPVDTKWYNRSGSAIVRGQILMMDVTGTATENTFDPTEGDTGIGKIEGIYANAIAPATAGLRTHPMGVCLDESVADDALGNFRLFGPCDAAVKDDDVAGADVDRSDPLTVADGVTYCLEASTLERIVGAALEDAAADSTVTARTIDASSHRRACFWNGLGFGFGANP